MAMFEDALKGGNIVTGLAIGIGMLLDALCRLPRPMPKRKPKPLLTADQVMFLESGATVFRCCPHIARSSCVASVPTCLPRPWSWGARRPSA